MKKKSDQLDQLVSDKLQQIQVEYNPAHWAQFEQLLDAQEAGVPVVEDRNLDEAVFEKLHQLKVSDRVTHWDRLAAKLDEHVDVRRELLFHKMMEAALLVLFVLIVAQYFPVQSIDAENITPKRPIASQQNTTTSEDAPLSDAALTNRTPAATESGNGKNDNATTDAQLPTGAATFNAAQKTIQAAKNNSPTVANGTKEAPLSKEKKAHLLSPSLPASRLLAPISTAESSGLDLPATAELPVNYTGVAERLELLSNLERIMLTELDYDGEPGYVMLLSPIKRSSAWVVSMFGSGDYNQVITPRSVEGDRIYDKLLRYAPGYGGGITAGLDLGRWEIGGGAIYTAKKYEPRPVVHLGGSFFDGSYDGEGLKYIELNMVQLPLYFRYNFIYHDKWRAYATMGFSLQVNFQTNYYYADEELFLQRPLPKPTQEYTPAKRSLPGGWLDGGALWQNGYISGNVSVGLERYITGRWSIFAQPTYHHSLNYFTQGIGPDKDRINTMSIFTGVRVRLND